MDLSALAHFISYILSIFTISLSVVAKIPQIRTIYKNKNARGINIYGLLMELSSYTTVCLYNYIRGYSLLTYLEYPNLILQNIVITLLVLHYTGHLGLRAALGASLYLSLVSAFALGFLPGQLITYVIPLCTPVSLSSKAVQLWEILRTKNADSVSITMWIISAVTNGSRIYTISLDSADFILLTNFTLSTLMSSSIALISSNLQRQSKKEKAQ